MQGRHDNHGASLGPKRQRRDDILAQAEGLGQAAKEVRGPKARPIDQHKRRTRPCGCLTYRGADVRGGSVVVLGAPAGAVPV